MFIVIEGIDGSGKGTQVKLLEEKLTKLGKKVKILDYPRYGEKSAYFVEKYLNGEYGKDISAKAASVLFAADRFDDFHSIKNDFKNYDFIISNRYISSNMIHQTGKIESKEQREDFLNWLEDLEYNIFGIKKPDRTIFLDISVDKSQELVRKKAKRDYIKGGKKMDIHEEDSNHLKNARNAARECAEKYNWTLVEVEKNNSLRSIEEINKEILEKILG